MTHTQDSTIWPEEKFAEELIDDFRRLWRMATPGQQETIRRLIEEAEPPGRVPYERIVELYHQTLPMLRGVKVWTSRRRSHVNARWRDMPDLEEWRRYFELVARCPHLIGKGSAFNGRVWEADFDWLINPQNYAKVVEGKYGD